MKPIIELIGWAGVLATLFAQALLGFTILESTSIWYQLLSILGIVTVIAAPSDQQKHQIWIMCVIWAIVALITIIKILFL